MDNISRNVDLQRVLRSTKTKRKSSEFSEPFITIPDYIKATNSSAGVHNALIYACNHSLIWNTSKIKKFGWVVFSVKGLDIDDVLNIKQLSKMSGYPISRIYTLIRNNIIHPEGKKGCWFFLGDEILSKLEKLRKYYKWRILPYG